MFDRKAIIDINQRKSTQQLNLYFRENYNTLVERIIAICSVPSPTFQEQNRTEFLRKLLLGDGFEAIFDNAGSVVTKYAGRSSNKALAVLAHVDTVFPTRVEIKVERTADTLSAPGIGDNSTSVASMVQIMLAWKLIGYEPPCDVFFVMDVGEEGLGDLCGARAFISDKQEILAAVIALDGTMGYVTNVGIGVRRLRVTIRTTGGHSWGNFPSPSAIHALGRCISEISDIKVPADPRTTYNVGVVEGGTSVNTIAEEATMLVDLRSVDGSKVSWLEGVVRDIVSFHCSRDDVTYTIEVVGDRPAGNIPPTHPLVETVLACASISEVEVSLGASSTDANIPLSIGIPAVAIGCYEGEGAHRLSEKIFPASLQRGLPYVNLALLAVLEWLDSL